MAKLLKLRRGTTSQHNTFTGAEGEVTIDTTKDTAVVHDGSTTGGTPLAKEDMSNVSSASIAGRLGTDSIATTKIAGGALPTDVTITNANIVANASIAGTKLENSGVTAGQYGSSSAIPIVTVDAQGLVTAASTTAIDSTTIANGSSSVSVANNGAITSNANHDFSAGIDVTGNITTTGTITSGGDLTINEANPSIFLNDTGDNPDYEIGNHDGAFVIQDDTNAANRLVINSDGHVYVTGNLDVGAGIDVTGASTMDGTVTINANTTTPALSLQGSGPNFIRFGDDQGDTSGMDLVFRTSPNTIGFETSDNATPKFTVHHGGQTTIANNLDVGAGLDVTGNITVTGTVDGINIAVRDTLFGHLTTTMEYLKTVSVQQHSLLATTVQKLLQLHIQIQQ